MDRFDPRYQALRRMRRLANTLLIVMTVIFVSTEAYNHSHQLVWLGYITAFAEAAMVGAVADWFAVTALFRYPLGVPIPHTAIIPNKQDRIAEALGSFVTNNFLQREILEEKMANLQLDQRLSDWMSEPKNRAYLSEQIAGFLPGLLNLLDDPEARNFLDKNLLKRINGEKIAPIIGKMLTQFARDQKSDKVIEGAFEWLNEMMKNNQRFIVDAIKKNLPNWLALFNDRISRLVVERLEKTLTEVVENPQHPLRQKIKLELIKYVEENKDTEKFQLFITNLKDEILNSPTVQENLEKTWQELKVSALDSLANPESELRKQLDETLYVVINHLIRDEKMRLKITGAVYSGALNLISSNRQALGGFIAETIKKWDRETLVARLEIQVGRDLQYIRINGTLVGGTVGLLLHLFSRML